MPDHHRRRRLAWLLLCLGVVLGMAGLVAGSDGWSISAWLVLWQGPDAGLVIGQIRAPRTVGAALAGALLGLAGALAQGLFRNPLADPYLLGSAAGASLGVVLVLGAGAITGHSISVWTQDALLRLGLVGAAFLGSLGGVGLTLMLSRGAHHTARLLLGGVIVGVVLGAASDMVTHVAPEVLRGKQSFMLGSTGFLGWEGCALLALGLLLTLPLAWAFSRALDALTLGEDSATSLGVPLPKVRLCLVSVLAFATAVAVSQTGLIAFVGLACPHLVRRFAPAAHGYLVVASAAVGACLLLGADVLSRALIAPQELPVGVLTALLGGGYLLWLMHGRRLA